MLRKKIYEYDVNEQYGQYGTNHSWHSDYDVRIFLPIKSKENFFALTNELIILVLSDSIFSRLWHPIEILDTIDKKTLSANFQQDFSSAEITHVKNLNDYSRILVNLSPMHLSFTNSGL